MQRRPATRISTADKIAFLRDPRHHDDRTPGVQVIETHFAWLFLTRRHVYKLKKPLRQWPLDYRRLASRQRGCAAELELNRRLAPGVYLDTVPLTRRGDGRLALGGRGHPVDWLVKMRRLPAAQMLDQRLLRGSVGIRDLERIAHCLAAFHARARRVPLGGAAYLRRLRQHTRGNRRALGARGLHPDAALIRAIAGAQLAFISAAGELLRARAGRIVDGHGDLRPEHVDPGPPVCIIDCLEFSAALRALDPAEELAFLAVECERMGAPAVGRRLIERHCAAAGDPVPAAVMHFYMSQRATTRAKISAWRLRDPRLADPVAWRDRTNSYLAQALRHAGRALALLAAGRHHSIRGRPAQQQRRERQARADAPQRRTEQRSH